MVRKLTLVTLFLLGFQISKSSPSVSAASPQVFLEIVNGIKPRGGGSNEWGKQIAAWFIRDCPDVQISIARSPIDYTAEMEHNEIGLGRATKIKISGKDGQEIFKGTEKGSVEDGVKKACSVILDDWGKKK